MKEKQHRSTFRLSEQHKAKLDKLAIQNGLSVNQTIANLIDKNSENEELKNELLAMKETVNYLSDSVAKQTKAIIDLITALKTKGVI